MAKALCPGMQVRVVQALYDPRSMLEKHNQDLVGQEGYILTMYGSRCPIRVKFPDGRIVGFHKKELERVLWEGKPVIRRV